MITPLPDWYFGAPAPLPNCLRHSFGAASPPARPEGPSQFAGGLGGRGPPENFWKIGFKMVLF